MNYRHAFHAGGFADVIKHIVLVRILTYLQDKQADLAFYLLDELRFSGAGDPLAALVLCGAHAADRVMIKGEWRLVGGTPLGVDVARLRAEHGEAARVFCEAPRG